MSIANCNLHMMSTKPRGCVDGVDARGGEARK
jgi:hypothetical protein